MSNQEPTIVAPIGNAWQALGIDTGCAGWQRQGMTKSALTKYRERRGATLQEIATLFGVNRSTVLRWETRRVPLHRAQSLSKTLGIPMKLLRPDLHRQFRD